jgi:hypothetical protein
MARRNQNTFLKRQKEIARVRKAKEKMDRRHGKKSEEEPRFGVTVSDEPSQEPGGGVAADEPSQDPREESAAVTSPDQ